MTGGATFDLVVPTLVRASLRDLLEALARCEGTSPGRVVLVDDRPEPTDDARAHAPAPLAERVVVVRSGGGGPAAARNAGWRRTTARWVAFLDDDVVVPPRWLAALHADLADLPDDVAGSQGRIDVPLPFDHRPTDWERNVAGLERARWATADMAYRRDVLAAVGGFDERFPRAYREDADLGLRVTDAGWRIVRGEREVRHPVRPAGRWVSVRKQAGNADDPMMRALHGAGWRERAGVPAGRRPWHLATVGAAALAGVAAARDRRGLALAAGAGGAWLTADFAWRRIAPGPRTADEVAAMVATSIAIPFAATAHWLGGIAALPWKLRRPGPVSELPAAMLFDRDGTLIHDVPYNGDPALVRPVDGAREMLDRLRRLGVPVGVVTNQSGIGRGLLTPQQVGAVNARVEELLGPFDAWAICQHAPAEGCDCRKPAPTLVRRAAEQLGVDPARCVLIGDIGSDVEAGLAAGARAILVPTAETLPAEVEAAPLVADDLRAAVDLGLGIADAAVQRPRGGREVAA